MLRVRRTSTEDAHPLPDPSQHFECACEFVLGVRGGHDRPYARLAFRHGGKSDARSEYSFFKQLARELHGQPSVADDNRRNRRLASRSGLAADVEAKQSEFLFPKPGVHPELLHELRLLFENIEGRNAGRSYRRRMRRRKQKRPRPMIKKIDEVTRAANVPAERANRFRQRPYLNVHSSMQSEMIDGAAAVAAKNTRRMRVVDHHDRSVFLSRLT